MFRLGQTTFHHSRLVVETGPKGRHGLCFLRSPLSSTRLDLTCLMSLFPSSPLWWCPPRQVFHTPPVPGLEPEVTFPTVLRSPSSRPEPDLVPLSTTHDGSSWFFRCTGWCRPPRTTLVLDFKETRSSFVSGFHGRSLKPRTTVSPDREDLGTPLNYFQLSKSRRRRGGLSWDHYLKEVWVEVPST